MGRPSSLASSVFLSTEITCPSQSAIPAVLFRLLAGGPTTKPLGGDLWGMAAIYGPARPLTEVRPLPSYEVGQMPTTVNSP